VNRSLAALTRAGVANASTGEGDIRPRAVGGLRAGFSALQAATAAGCPVLTPVLDRLYRPAPGPNRRAMPLTQAQQTSPNRPAPGSRKNLRSLDRSRPGGLGVARSDRPGGRPGDAGPSQPPSATAQPGEAPE
jgi:hypothetical protein